MDKALAHAENFIDPSFFGLTTDVKGWLVKACKYT